jgi:predicted RNA-binding protein with PUA-like domain
MTNPQIKYDIFFTHPNEFSRNDILKNGHFKIYGVRDEVSKSLLGQMKVGDKVRYSDSSINRTMGILEVTKTAHQDPTTNEKWVSVDFAPIVNFMYGTYHNFESNKPFVRHFNALI